jgi:hypothetical protein
MILKKPLQHRKHSVNRRERERREREREERERAMQKMISGTPLTTTSL